MDMDMTMDPSRVVSLHRYPVKSMLGEQVSVMPVDRRGCQGDRRWSVRTTDGKIGSGKSSRRFAALDGLQLLRAAQPDGEVTVTFPDGRVTAASDPATSDLVSDHVGQPVTLVTEDEVSHFDDGPVSLIGLASVAAVSRELGVPVDPARFRGNVLLDTAVPFAEDALVGRTVRLGDAVLLIELSLPRCVMVNAATADLPALPGHLAAVGRVNDAHLGVVGRVITPGRIGVDDVLVVG